MKILITGANGQLGSVVCAEAEKRGHIAIGSDIQYDSKFAENYINLDITDKASVRFLISKIKPDAIIHCAAWTAVDDAQDEENVLKVFAINHNGTRNLAEAAKEVDAKMIYISTDYIFDGQGEEPWKAECTAFNPLNVYGASKLFGELDVTELVKKFFIVRIAWVFGPNGHNFVKTMLKLSDTHDELRVVSDQIGTPTYTVDLARLLIDMVETDKYGIYHATNDEEGRYISWAQFAREIFEQAGKETEVIPVTTEEYGLSKARRPFNSRLDKSRLELCDFKPLPNWKDALKRYLEILEQEGHEN